jgi:hypothetical protein
MLLNSPLPVPTHLTPDSKSYYGHYRPYTSNTMSGRTPNYDWSVGDCQSSSPLPQLFAASLTITDLDVDPLAPPPPVGAPLLNAEQELFFNDFFNTMPADMIPSVNPAEIFDPELSKDMIWPDIFQTNENYYQAPAPHLDINPFRHNHELITPRDHVNMATAPGLLNFGTDTNFAPNGYHPPNILGMDKEAEARSKVYSALTRNESVVTTAINSPAEVKDEPEVYTPGNDSTPGISESSMSPTSGTKRRAQDGDLSPSRQRKQRARTDSATPKIKKKVAQKRDNLTEAQKRENHIHSEQKRRNLIRQGFEELCALVPELKAGGYSKSAVLIHAANYLDDLKKGNATLRVYLQQLEVARGGM